jgi:hypothetical protein
MRSGRVAFAAVFALGLVALAIAGFARTSDLVYSPGVNPFAPILDVAPGQRACQGPMHSPNGDEFDRIAFSVASLDSPVRGEVIDAASNRTLATGRLAAGAGGPEHVVKVGAVRTRAPVQACIVNEGAKPLSVYGQVAAASAHTAGTLDGKDPGVDFAFTLRREPRSVLSLLPTMADRATLFRAGWVTPAAYLVLALLILVLAPLLLARGLGRAALADRDA